MRRANFIRHSVIAVAAGFVMLAGVHCASAAPLPSSTVLAKTAAPTELTTVGYIYRDYDGGLVNAGLALGFVAASAVGPFYTPSYYSAYVYPAPPVYYMPLPYVGPAIAYGRPLLAADPYYPAFYPYVRGAGYYGYWRRYRY